MKQTEAAPSPPARALGGLATIARNNSEPPVIHTSGHDVVIPLSRIHITGWNDRTIFDPGKLQELADSIQKTNGVLQAVLVRPHRGTDAKNPEFDLVFGERRYRASKLAKFENIRATVRSLTDQQVVEWMVIENQQREDLNPLEEAKGYARLMAFAMSAAQIAEKVTLSKRHVEARLQLLKLGPPAQKALLSGELDATRAQAIVKIPDEKMQAEAMAEILKQSMTSREAETFITENYTRTLRGAPWKLDDATLLPRAGACATCPLNARNMGEGKSADVCTDLACYGRKLDAHWARLKAEVAQDKTGRHTILEAKPQDIFWDHGAVRREGLRDLDSSCYDAPGGRNYRDLLRGTDVPIVLARDRQGNIHELVPKAEAQKALEASGALRRERFSGGGGGRSAADKRAAQQGIIDRRVMEAGLVRLGVAAQKAPTMAFWRWLAMEIWENAAADACKMAGLVRGELIKGQGGHELKLDHVIEKADEGQLRELIVQLLCSPPYGLSHISECFERAAKLYNLDLKKLEAEVKAAKKNGKPMIPAKLGEIVESINKGYPLPWPKGANAVRVTYPGGKKPHVSMKDGVAELKGVGIPMRVEFGIVPNSRSKPFHPLKDQFKAVKS